MKAARFGSVLVVALLLGLAFAAFYAGTSRGVFAFGDDILMFQVTAAIWDRGEVAVTSPAWRGDNARSIPGREHQRFAKYGLGPSLVALPFYGASHLLFDRFALPTTADRWGNLRTGPEVFGTGLANAAIGGATVAVTFLLAVELGYPLLAALATALCLGAATLLAHYAGTFLSEPLSALCIAIAFLGLLKAESGGPHQAKRPVKGEVAARWWLALSGFAAGLAVATKVAHLVIILPLLVWAAVLGWRRTRLRGAAVHSLYWSSCFLIWAGIIAAYNWSRFGNVLETGYGREAEKFTTPLWVGLTGLLASPAKGIFWYCPVLLLALAGGLAFWRRHRVFSLAILAASALWLLLIARYYQWYGGGCWGPRFLVPLLPLWILPLSEILVRARPGGIGKAGAVLAIAIGAASFVTTATALVVPFDQAADPVGWLNLDDPNPGWKIDSSPLTAALVHLPAGLVVTAKKLAGRLPLGEAGRGGLAPWYPDFAFEHYGSHGLLVWTRRCFLLAAAALALAFALARRSSSSPQKALLSRPPQ